MLQIKSLRTLYQMSLRRELKPFLLVCVEKCRSPTFCLLLSILSISLHMVTEPDFSLDETPTNL